MAIYHLSVKTVSRAAGRSATAAAAYRAGVEIIDERTGEIHDYRRKGGVESAVLVLPADAPNWAADRATVWNAAEQAEMRKNSTVAREFEVALPMELSAAERRRLAHDFARELVARHGCAADVAIHAPGKEGDNRNHHAHILCSTRRLTPVGFTEKTRELDDLKTGEVTRWRERFAELQNERLREAGHAVRVDHRRLAAQGIEREPTRHLGPAATGYERRAGEASRRRLDWQHEAAERLARAKLSGDLERQSRQLERSILDLSGDLAAAKAECNRRVEAGKQQARPPTARADMPALGASLVDLAPSRPGGTLLTDMTAVQEVPTRQTFYGWIVAPESDRAFLSSLGVELGPYNALDDKFPAKVDAMALRQLEEWRGTFALQLTALDDGLVDPETQRLGVPLAQVKPETLAGYQAYLRYMVASEQGGGQAVSALAEANREKHRRTLAPAALQRAAAPDSLDL
ncbi:MobQ family relaxase [Cupriavidus sp. CuC1]|uniref:MobQ family relaxase n=1 Tax=Cupriavidus sp. CuC1 TaxID=3373131 RepID=UPI0037D2CF1E